MTEPRRDTIIVQREIAATRSHLVTDIERLRGALRRRLSLRTQVQAHPRVVAAVVLVLSLPLFALTFAARTAYARHKRAQRQRWLAQGAQRAQRWLLR